MAHVWCHPQRPSALLSSTLASACCALGHTKVPTHLFSSESPPWGPWTSSGKASSLVVPGHLTGLVTEPRSHFPQNVCLRASLPHSKINFLPQDVICLVPPRSGHAHVHLEYSRAGFIQRWHPLPVGRRWLRIAGSLGNLKGFL